MIKDILLLRNLYIVCAILPLCCYPAHSSFAGEVLISAIQYRAVPSDKISNIKALKKMISEAAGHGVQLVVLPEMSTTGLNIQSVQHASLVAESIPGPTTEKFAALAKNYNIYIIMGLLEVDLRQNKYYNSQIILGPQGIIEGKYRKRNLYGLDYNWAATGDLGYKAIQTKFGKVGLGICYDINSQDLFDFFYQKRVDIFAFSTNWIGGEIPYSYWLNILNNKKIFFIAANNWGSEGSNFSGGSIIVSPNMEILVQSANKNDGILIAKIEITKEPWIVYLKGLEPFHRYTISSSSLESF
ncbi:MAG TPA: carbon-nitrogen hydrolase family protein [Nitrospirota bacterium]|nr:carbon-nitrogen hydrolase family protein [Nitrospirota bacterium]